VTATRDAGAVGGPVTLDESASDKTLLQERTLVCLFNRELVDASRGRPFIAKRRITV